MNDNPTMRRKILTDREIPDSGQISKWQNYSRVSNDYALLRKAFRMKIILALKSFTGLTFAVITGLIIWNTTHTTKAPVKPAEGDTGRPLLIIGKQANAQSWISRMHEIKKMQVAAPESVDKPQVDPPTQYAGISNSRSTENVQLPGESVLANKANEAAANENKLEQPIENKSLGKDSIGKIVKKQPLPHENKTDSDKIIYNTSNIEVQPEFPGGNPALLKFLSDNLKYPEIERGNNIQGKTYVSFVIDKNGRVGNTEIVKGIMDGKRLDEEAIRVVKSMPYWKPGRQNGKPVRVKYVLPIQFKTMP